MSDRGLKLDVPRDVRALFASAVRVYAGNLGPVLAATGAVVLVVDVIAALGLHQLTGHYVRNESNASIAVQLLVEVFVTLPNVNAAMAFTLVDVAAGERPRAIAVLQRALDAFAPALVPILIYAVAVAAGVIVFILLPVAVYLLVSWYFAVQSVAIDGKRGFAALMHSAQLVSGNWWRTFGVVLLAPLLGGVTISSALGLLIDEAAKSLDSQLVVVAGEIVLQTLTFSFVALVSGLLFFDLRARRAAPRRTAGVDGGTPIDDDGPRESEEGERVEGPGV